MIELVSVSKSFGNIHALKDISIQFSEDKIHGIVGLNGAGKTTLYNVLCGIYPYNGTIIYKDKKLLNNIHKIIAMLPTSSYFFPRSTAEEYLTFIATAKGLKVNANDIQKYNLFNLPLRQYINAYSSGMKKKLAFAGMLIGEYEMYILDEPFNGVDLQGNIILKREILKLKEEEKTVFISSHTLSSLTDICDEIHLLDKGCFIESFSKNNFASIENALIHLIPD